MAECVDAGQTRGEIARRTAGRNRHDTGHSARHPHQPRHLASAAARVRESSISRTPELEGWGTGQGQGEAGQRWARPFCSCEQDGRRLRPRHRRRGGRLQERCHIRPSQGGRADGGGRPRSDHILADISLEEPVQDRDAQQRLEQALRDLPSKAQPGPERLNMMNIGLEQRFGLLGPGCRYVALLGSRNGRHSAVSDQASGADRSALRYQGN